MIITKKSFYAASVINLDKSGNFSEKTKQDSFLGH